MRLLEREPASCKPASLHALLRRERLLAWQVCRKAACLAGPTVGCDDGNPCTTTLATARWGRVGVNDDTNTCSDSNTPAPKGEYCSAGGCVAGTPKICDDNDLCTVDSCDPNAGCPVLPESADADACTDDCAIPTSGACTYPQKSCDEL
jgi:hypothetical protein